MSQKLYEEALADAKKVTEVAETNAKNAVLEAVVPRIKSLIEQELLSEDATDDILLDDDPLMPDSSVPDVVVKAGTDVAVADAITPPDEEGKVTLDLDALGVDDETSAVDSPLFGADTEENEEFELSLESSHSLKALKTNPFETLSEVTSGIKATSLAIKKFAKAGRLIRESKGFNNQITRMISRVENMYEYVQESVKDPAKKETYNNRLEKLFQNLNKLQETAVSKRNRKNRLYEEDETQMDFDVDGGDESVEASDGELTLKLTGLPDDVELDDVGVDLVADEDDEGDEDLDVDMGGDDMGDDMGDLDLDDSGDDQATQLESVLRLPDDTVVEIDEGMLRREIKKMVALRESVPVNAPADELDANGHGTPSNVLDDFGGGHDEGEPILDVDVCADPTAEPLGEGDEEDMDVMDEMDDMDVPMESVKRRLRSEARLQKKAKAFGARLKTEARRSRGRRRAALIARYNKVATQYNESVAKSKRLKKRLTEASQRMRSNSASQNRSGEVNLRRKLAESNLNNVKLAYANKVLQNESLTRRQKGQVVRQLDECRTVREAKLTYENVAKVVARRRSGRALREGARPGAGSRATRRGSSSQTLNEGVVEVARWGRLAGIDK